MTSTLLPLDPEWVSALAVPSRAQLLRVLRAAAAPQTVAELADAVGLHVNTARAHLELLVKARLVARSADSPHGPGRPRTVYALAPDAPATVTALSPAAETDGRYRELASALVDELAANVNADWFAVIAVNAGRRWASIIDEMDWPDRAHTADEARARLVELLARLGFKPSTEPLGDRIYLHTCPFAELARRNPAVVCGVHRGLVQAAVGRLRTPLTVSAVSPFARDNVCVIQLGTTD